MKTAFKISPRFPVNPDSAKHAARFCIREAVAMCRYRNLVPPLKVSFTMRKADSWQRSGRAAVNDRRKSPMWNSRVFLRLNRSDRSYTDRYHRYADSPTCLIDGTIEGFIHLCAHELGHAVCGFEGDKIGEFQCERFAARTLDAWRLAYQDPAAMI